MTLVIEQTRDTNVLALVLQKKAERLRAIAAELKELAADGVRCPYTAFELLELEQSGLVYDFVTGAIVEVA